MGEILTRRLTLAILLNFTDGTFNYLFHQTSVVANTDTHIAAVKEGSFVWLYVDGVKSSTSINMTAKTIRLNGSTTATHIGKLSSSLTNNSMNGYIRDLRIKKKRFIQQHLLHQPACFNYQFLKNFKRQMTRGFHE